MIDEIIARECPRYVKKEIIYHGKNVQAIIDTHTRPIFPTKIASIGDKNIDRELDKMNTEYENQLRNHFKEGIQ